MGCLKVILFLHVLVFGAIVGLFWAAMNDHLPPMPEVPDIPEKWFGPGKRVKEDPSIRPFTIKVDSELLTDLKHRIDLDLKRLSAPLEDSNFNYGFNSAYLKEVGQYWRDKFDWKKQEEQLNKFKHFKTMIDGIDVHFIHQKPDPKEAEGKTVIPLLVIHGWPGSVHEFHKLIPILTRAQPDRDFVFEVVAPSIPGYGWSSAPHKPGFDQAHCARIFTTLMTDRLGFKKFYSQGGDWGSVITSMIGTLYPEKVHGIHVNIAIAFAPAASLKQILAAILPSGWIFDHREEYKVLPLGAKFVDMILESGYLHIQATKPDTVGTAVGGTPLGLAAYILEKFSTWTSRSSKDFPDGRLTHKYSLDDLLTNVMIYWTTNSMTSSMRFYAENFSFKEHVMALNRIPIKTVPTGIANFPNEIMLQPLGMIQQKFKHIIQITDYTDGGHFAAFEMPQVLADDIWQFVEKVRKAGKQEKTKSEL